MVTLVEILHRAFYLLILCIHIVFCTAAWNTKDYLKREHSLLKPYQASTWDSVGSTMITNSFVRLTPEQQSKQGGIWNSIPLRVSDWELHIHFKVHGASSDLFGDGIAIWYVRDKQNLGDVFGSKNHFVGLGVFLDTYSNHNGPHNHQHPYVSAMVSNGSLIYDHDRDGTLTQLAGCESSFRNTDHDTLVAIRYTGSSDRLRVSTDTDGKGTWKECFVVEGVRLPTHYFLGASAATGDLADNHDIISMKLYELEPEKELDKTLDRKTIDPSAVKFETPREHHSDPSPGWFGRLYGFKLLAIIIGLIVVIGFVGVVAFFWFSDRQDYRRKRFY